MQVLRAEQVTWKGAAENFTGRVWMGEMQDPEDPGGLRVLGVLFEPGARSDWHSHPGGQVLYVVSGAGRVGTSEGISEIGPGDVVRTPPGEEHWHGAGPEGFLYHLSLTTVGPTEWSSRSVTDSEYQSSSAGT